MPTFRMRRRLLGLALATAFLPGAARALETDSNELAARMNEDASALLDQLLGPGQAKLFIRVEGERSEQQTQSENITPPKTAKDNSAPPGYAASPYLDRTRQFMLQRDLQQTTRVTGFVVRRIDVSLLLDQDLPDARVEGLRKVVSDMLRLDTARGDTIVVLKASLYPAWRRLLMTPDVWKALISQAGLITGVLLACTVGYMVMLRGARSIAEAVASRRGGPVEGAPREFSGSAAAALGPGGLPSMAELEEGGGAGLPALENQPKFGYLGTKPPREVARWLQGEPPEELALLFGWMADSSPELGTKLFTALPAETQLSVSKVMVKLKQSDPERIGLLDNRLRTKVEQSMRGADKLGLLISRMPVQERENLMGDLSAADAEGSREVQKSLVTFEDLAGLKVEDMRRLVAAVPLQIWSQALRGAEKSFADKVLELLPAGMRPMLKEAMEASQPKEKVVEARSRILTQATTLASQGQLTLKAETQPEVL